MKGESPDVCRNTNQRLRDDRGEHITPNRFAFDVVAFHYYDWADFPVWTIVAATVSARAAGFAVLVAFRGASSCGECRVSAADGGFVATEETRPINDCVFHLASPVAGCVSTKYTKSSEIVSSEQLPLHWGGCLVECFGFAWVHVIC